VAHVRSSWWPRTWPRSGATDPGRRRDRPLGATSPIVELTRAVSAIVPRTRLLYLYPSALTDDLIQAVLDTGVPYFDLSLQHVARPLVARMRRWGDGQRFLDRIADIRRLSPDATFRSSFILGYPGETEEDHDELLAFLAEAELDWAGFFPFSPEEGTHAVDLVDQVDPALAMDRLRECAELQDAITARRRDAMVGRSLEVLVDAPGIGRSVHEAPEIDGVIQLPRQLVPGQLVDVVVTASLGTDLVAEEVAALGRQTVGAAS
jgi:ribosomal protein S12 methylthiotransferase